MKELSGIAMLPENLIVGQMFSGTRGEQVRIVFGEQKFILCDGKRRTTLVTVKHVAA